MPGDFHRRGIKVRPTVSAREAMQEAYDVLTTGARKTGAEFTEPDDDWRPMWVILTKTQGTHVTGNAHKHAMTDYVATLARKYGAVAVGHLHSSWMIHAQDVDEQRFDEIHAYLRQGGSLEDVPESREQLMLNLHSAGETRQYHARIHRDGVRPPALDPFELAISTAEKNAEVSGAMSDPIVAALRRIG